MIRKEFNVFLFTELSKEAQERVILDTLHDVNWKSREEIIKLLEADKEMFYFMDGEFACILD